MNGDNPIYFHDQTLPMASGNRSLYDTLAEFFNLGQYGAKLGMGLPQSFSPQDLMGYNVGLGRIIDQEMARRGQFSMAGKPVVGI